MKALDQGRAAEGQVTSDVKTDEIEPESELTCPACGHQSRHVMPTDACLFFHECEGCKTLLRPKRGDCCVFCSYGTVPCPPIQEARKSGGAASCC